jgi:hypothetical protein
MPWNVNQPIQDGLGGKHFHISLVQKSGQNLMAVVAIHHLSCPSILGFSSGFFIVSRKNTEFTPAMSNLQRLCRFFEK